MTALDAARPAVVLSRLRDRREWMFLAALPRAHRRLAIAWWALLIVRGLLPAVFAIAMGNLVAAVTHSASLAGPLSIAGVVFVAMQVLTPVHQAVSNNLGDRTSAWLYDQLTSACVDPPGIGHLEDSTIAGDMVIARDFDLGMQGPPLSISMDFIADGLVTMLGGVACSIVLFGYAWWAPLVLAGAWGATHWLLRESGVWRDRNTDEVRSAQQEALYTYRLAVDAPPAKEVRLYGLAEWIIDRFVARRRRMHELQYEATRLREKSVVASLVVVLVGNAAVFGALGASLAGRHISLGAAVAFAQAAIGVSSIAFGGLNWALDGAASPVKAVAKVLPSVAIAGALDASEPAHTSAPAADSGAAGDWATAGGPARVEERRTPHAVAVAAMPARDVRFHDVTFAYPGASVPVLRDFNLTIPAGTSLAIVGRNGAGKTTLAKLLCRLYDPQTGAVEVDGVDIRALDVAAWRSRITAVFQDFIRFELSLRDNVAPLGASDEVVHAALHAAGAASLTDLDTVLSKGYPGGTDLSGGQWQRVALARTVAAVRQGAGLVLLDEPTAQLDARGEAEIFSRILGETRDCTTVLISHRFSTVRQADRICVVEHGAVVELGSHEELMDRGGRYRTMFDLQAQRFSEGRPADDEEEDVVYDTLG